MVRQQHIVSAFTEELDQLSADLLRMGGLAEAMIRDAHAQGVTIVMVTHDLGQARRLADDVVFVHGGRVVETGPAAQMLTAPSSGPARAWNDGRLYFDPASD